MQCANFNSDKGLALSLIVYSDLR